MREPPCRHFEEIHDVSPSPPDGCAECLRAGTPWVHLRVCLTCGHVGCCDDSPMRHASAHFDGTAHPVMKSYEPGETWGWCYVDEAALDPVPGPAARRHFAPPGR
ncbi:MAG: ubiquitin carboxyl-terminal hydrolase 14 [Usitatibacter sp.]